MVAIPAVVPEHTTRDALLNAAERRFAEQGLAGASVRDIAADAGLKNQASLYHYFRNKDALYIACLQRGVDVLMPVWRGEIASPGGDRRMTVAAYLDRIFGHMTEHPHLAALIERAGMEEDARVRRRVRVVLRPLYDAGLAALESSGVRWPRTEMPHLAAGIFHLIFGYFANAALLRVVIGDDPYNPAMIARQRRFLTQAVTRLLDDGVSPRRRGGTEG
jgi:AcrR family transcriptional regulator